MKLPVLYILTHDSIGVGEDGPTHQPIEHLASIRAIPDTNLIPPRGQKETAAAYIAALSGTMPTALALTRQNLPQLEETDVKKAMLGGYILRGSEKPDVILMASGSEVELAMKAADELEAKGKKVRVVSMPCTDIFDRQARSIRRACCPAR